MFRIIDNRGSGKTSRLMLLAKETNSVIACANPYAMKQKALAYGIVGIDFISYNDLLSGEYENINVMIDEIEMFVKENSDDELVFDDVTDLKAMAEELRRNFIVLESKIQNIVEKKEGKNLLLDNKKITRKEIIEIETYRFLNKYGYDISKKETEKEPKYQDTMANEIARIVEYINSAKIL